MLANCEEQTQILSETNYLLSLSIFVSTFFVTYVTLSIYVQQGPLTVVMGVTVYRCLYI